MNCNKLYVLDVGHGNCAVYFGPEGVVVVDAGSKSTLLEFLCEKKVSEIDTVLISHADADHIAGLLALLTNGIVIKKIYMNTDSIKGSNIFLDLIIAIRDSEIRIGSPELYSSLTTNESNMVTQGGVSLEITAPSPHLAVRGPGSTDLKKRRISSNAMSAVVRVIRNGKPLVVLPGDLDWIGLQNLIEDGKTLNAELLVFPHHGGKVKESERDQFVQELCRLSKPKYVVFSIGRGMHKTPNPSIVSKIRELLPKVRIVCTQLSEHCSAVLPSKSPSHLNKDFAQGRSKNCCCAGTILIDLEAGFECFPELKSHGSFISSFVSTALCAS